MMFYHKNRKLPNADVGIREWANSIRGLITCFLREMWKNLKLSSRIIFEHYKQGLMCSPVRILEDSPESSLDCGASHQKLFHRRTIENRLKAIFLPYFDKNVAAF